MFLIRYNSWIKIKPFINRNKWEGIHFPSEKDGKIREKANWTVALNVLYAKKEKIYLVYVWKHDSNYENQVILLMIPKFVNRLSELLRGVTSKHHSDLY